MKSLITQRSSPMLYFRRKTFLCLLLLQSASLSIASADIKTPERLASQIFRSTGVKGGLIVHLGCGEGKLTTALYANESYIVHGLDTNPAHVDSARNYIKSRNLYGKVCIDHWSGPNLPYVDNSVNLIVAEKTIDLTPTEIDRVLCPGGVAYLKRNEQWTRQLKPWPTDIDQWTHTLHGPDNNAVSSDRRVGPPRSLQWAGPPARARQHENLASISVVVSADGRIFSIQDETSAASQLFLSRWFLVARDAFNGVILWKLSLGTWESHLRPFRMGPVDLSRRLVAADSRVFVTLGYGKPVSALDAATGKLLTEYQQTQGTCEIIYAKGVLYIVAGQFQITGPENKHLFGQTNAITDKRIAALDSLTGKVLWTKSNSDTTDLMANTLTLGNNSIFFQNPREIICLNADDGTLRWRIARKASVERPAWSSPTLVVCGDVLLSADRALPEQIKAEPQRKHISKWIDSPRGELIAFSAADGKRLWSAPCREGFHAPTDVLVVDGLVWTGDLAHAKDPGITAGRDLKTGQVKRTRPPDSDFFEIGMPHHRCFRNRATENYLVLGRAGVELVDVNTGSIIPNHWIRGTCQFGVLPCNGLLNIPPHSCACYLQAKLNGFCALSSTQSYLKKPVSSQNEQSSPSQQKVNQEISGTIDSFLTAANWLSGPDRLQRGPAYQALETAKLPSTPPADDWPTFRRDFARSGSVASPISPQLTPTWQTSLSAPLTTLTAGAGKVFVAARDQHCLYALDAATGKVAWQFFAGGRIDSPPTILGNWLWFGSHDGSIYCLRASDGRLAWRFLAAPYDRRAVVFGQLESLWPVPGNVFVRDGVAFSVAGRCSYLDGGMLLWRLDAATGKVLSHTPIEDRDPNTGYQPDNVTEMFDMPGLLPDVLSAADNQVFLRQVGFNLEGIQQDQTQPHLFSPTGLLDDSWWHRSYWIYGKRYYTGYRDWFRAGHEVPAGRLLVFDRDTVYGFGRCPQYFNWSTLLEYQLFSCAKHPELVPTPKNPPRLPQWGKKQIAYKWQKDIPLLARAMVLTGENLFVAGPPRIINESQSLNTWFTDSEREKLKRQAELFAGRGEAVLLVVSAAEGKILARHSLEASPVFDGMIASQNRLFLAAADGKVICLAPEEK